MVVDENIKLYQFNEKPLNKTFNPPKLIAMQFENTSVITVPKSSIFIFNRLLESTRSNIQSNPTDTKEEISKNIDVSISKISSYCVTSRPETDCVNIFDLIIIGNVNNRVSVCTTNSVSSANTTFPF